MHRMEDVLKKINPNSQAPSSESALKDELDYAREVVERFVSAWSATSSVAVTGHQEFTYGEKFLVKDPVGDELRLLKPFGKKSSDDAFDTLTSMRNVDGSVQGSLIVEA